VKKQSIHVVCEHFEPFHNAAMDAKIVFEIGSTIKREMIFILKLSKVAFLKNVIYFRLAQKDAR